MQQIVYKVDFVRDPGNGEALQTLLNERAAGGWKPMHFQVSSNDSWTIVFEMPNPSQNPTKWGRVQT
jgi:hypothetical protein